MTSTREPHAGQWMSARPYGMLLALILSVVMIWLAMLLTMHWRWTPQQRQMWRPYVKSSVTAALKLGPREYLLNGVRGRRENIAVREWLAREVYGGQRVTDLVFVPFIAGATIGFVFVMIGIGRDGQRRQERRQGKRVRGVELVSGEEWNARMRRNP